MNAGFHTVRETTYSVSVQTSAWYIEEKSASDY